MLRREPSRATAAAVTGRDVEVKRSRGRGRPPNTPPLPYLNGAHPPFTPEQDELWLARADLERRARRITPLQEEVARALLRTAAHPRRTLALVADEAACSEKTVRIALRAMRAYSLVG